MSLPCIVEPESRPAPRGRRVLVVTPPIISMSPGACPRHLRHARTDREPIWHIPRRIPGEPRDDGGPRDEWDPGMTGSRIFLLRPGVPADIRELDHEDTMPSPNLPVRRRRRDPQLQPAVVGLSRRGATPIRTRSSKPSPPTDGRPPGAMECIHSITSTPTHTRRSASPAVRRRCCSAAPMAGSCRSQRAIS